MNILVIDLEFNGRRHYDIYPMEIIEIGAVKINENGDILDTFQSYVRPLFPIHDFALDFCGIERETLAASEPFTEVIGRFKVFCGNPCTLIAWGKTDFFHLLVDCKTNGISTDWLTRMIDMSTTYTGGLQQALEEHHIELTGKQHSALDDALHAHRLLLLHLEIIHSSSSYKADPIKISTGGIKKKMSMDLNQAVKLNQVLSWEQFVQDEQTQQYIAIMKLTPTEIGYMEHMFRRYFKQVYGRGVRARLKSLGIDI
ncbi:Inhibitor of the KinA pathway to sporulation, predicted exonuclease [Paenibacillus sp. UNCCL117]|nr:Inhibitor of the KinA pathway to sporulation, predicted exonuclease [Paenibacillus sp. cl123]SFW71157.1 Inhibitor of the KinA pathway to sporulation, predicted exonuclease [Paenibacillus sp. UNCCL117]